MHILRKGTTLSTIFLLILLIQPIGSAEATTKIGQKLTTDPRGVYTVNMWVTVHTEEDGTWIAGRDYIIEIGGILVRGGAERGIDLYSLRVEEISTYLAKEHDVQVVQIFYVKTEGPPLSPIPTPIESHLVQVPYSFAGYNVSIRSELKLAVYLWNGSSWKDWNTTVSAPQVRVRQQETDPFVEQHLQTIADQIAFLKNIAVASGVTIAIALVGTNLYWWSRIKKLKPAQA